MFGKLTAGAFPVFGREGDVPEIGGGLDELDADLGLVALLRAEKNHAALDVFLGGGIGEHQALAVGDGVLEQHQCAMGVDRLRGGFLLKLLSGGAFAENDYPGLNKYALAAAARRSGGTGRSCSHSVSPSCETIPVFPCPGK